MNCRSQQPVPPLVAWVIWAAILFGLFILQFFIAGGFKTGEAAASVPLSMIAICLAGVVISNVIRWLVLPRQTTMAKQLPIMIIGLALAESTGLLSMFIIGDSYPSLQLSCFVMAVITIALYMPVYAKE